MSCFPKVCTPKKHFEQNLQRRGERRGLDFSAVMEALHSLGESAAKANLPQPSPFPSLESCKGIFGGISALSWVLDPCLYHRDG